MNTNKKNPYYLNKNDLYSIIKNRANKPDYLAIDIYCNIRNHWFYNSKNKTLHKTGIKTNYKALTQKHKRCRETIRQKLNLLENLELIKRKFIHEYRNNKLSNNNLYIFLLLEQKMIKNFTPPIQEKWERPLPENLASLQEKWERPLPENLEIYNSIDNNISTMIDRSLNNITGGNKVSTASNNNNYNKNTDNDNTTVVVEKNDIFSKSNRLIDLQLNQEILDVLRKRSKKPHFSNERIINIIHKILEKKPTMIIFGGTKGFINYMTKVLLNERDLKTDHLSNKYCNEVGKNIREENPF